MAGCLRFRKRDVQELYKVADEMGRPVLKIKAGVFRLCPTQPFFFFIFLGIGHIFTMAGQRSANQN
jgi:hypothetical protein